MSIDDRPGSSTPGQGTIEQAGDRWKVTFVRELDAAIEEVWDAITDPDRVGRWLAPTHLEARVGGTVSHDFGDDAVTGRIRVLEPPNRLEYTWRFSDGTDSLLRIELEPSAAGTRLTLVHRDLPQTTAIGYAAGWHSYLDRLAAVVRGNEPPAWEPTFDELLPSYTAAAG